MRSSIPDIRIQLQKVLERGEPLAATRVVTDADQYVALNAIRAVRPWADRDAAKAAYRAPNALYADHPLHHSETLRSVACAREAIERLAPVPPGTVNQEGLGRTPVGAERLN